MSDLTPGQRWTDGPPPTVSGDAPPPQPPTPPEGPPPPPPPAEPYPQPEQPRSGDNNIWLILTGVAVIVLLLGAIVYVVTDDDDDEGGGNGVTATGNVDSTDSEDPGGLGEPDDTSEPSGDTTTTSTTTTSTTTTSTTVPLAPAQADIGDCIAVTESGNFLGTDSCDSGGTPYRVKNVVDAVETCPNSNHGSVVSGDFLLCVEINVLETFCYVFPKDPETGGIGGWITPASACETSGTVHVVDIVPGATQAEQGNSCTSEFQWNYWYEILAPQAVVCVMEY